MSQVGAEAAQVINAVIGELPALDVAHNQMVIGHVADGDNRARRMLEDHLGSRGYHIASVHIASARDHLHQMASFVGSPGLGSWPSEATGVYRRWRHCAASSRPFSMTTRGRHTTAPLARQLRAALKRFDSIPDPEEPSMEDLLAERRSARGLAAQRVGARSLI